MKKVTCKFEQMLGANMDNVRASRAKLIADQTLNALTRHIGDIENEVTTKKLELDRLTDLAPDTTDSLRPGGNNFKPAEFVTKCLGLRQEIKIMEDIDLEDAYEFREEMFGEIEVEEKPKVPRASRAKTPKAE